MFIAFAIKSKGGTAVKDADTDQIEIYESYDSAEKAKVRETDTIIKVEIKKAPKEQG